jgi:hypothetical protein
MGTNGMGYHHVRAINLLEMADEGVAGGQIAAINDHDLVLAAGGAVPDRDTISALGLCTNWEEVDINRVHD